MRRLILKMSMSLDGFVAGPNGEIDWMLRGRDEAARDWTIDTLRQTGLHAMGSRTFFDMAAYWPTSTEAFAAPMNEIPKIVFTRQKSLNLGAGPTTNALRDAREAQEDVAASPAPAAASWAAAEVAKSDLTAEIERLRSQPGKDILAHGGAGFAQSLAAAGLIDEYRLLVHPVALGSGLSLFGALPKPLDLELRTSSLFRSGVAAHVYRPA
jgi:dihydrofolate reductase